MRNVSFPRTFENGLQVGHRDPEHPCISVCRDGTTTKSFGSSVKEVVCDGRNCRFPRIARDKMQSESFRICRLMRHFISTRLSDDHVYMSNELTVMLNSRTAAVPFSQFICHIFHANCLDGRRLFMMASIGNTRTIGMAPGEVELVLNRRKTLL